MKYSILINQAGIMDAGLGESTDWIDWAIIEYIADWQLYDKAQRLEDHVWLDYKHLMTEMPMLKFNSKSSVSNRIAKLSKLDLLSVKRDDFSRVFVKLTDLSLSVRCFRPDFNPPKKEEPNKSKAVPENERGVPENERGVPENERGVPENEHSINNQLINNQNKSPKNKKESTATPKPASKFKLPDFINADAWNEFEQHRKDIRKPMTDMARTKAINLLKDLTEDQQQEVIDYSIAGRYPGLYPDRIKQKSPNPATNRNSGSTSTRTPRIPQNDNFADKDYGQSTVDLSWLNNGAGVN